MKAAVFTLALFLGLSSAQFVSVPRSNCAWRGGDYGVYTNCLSDEVAVGSCGSGADPDCSNPTSGEDEYDMIYCCAFNQLDNYRYDQCDVRYGSYGEDVSCVTGGDDSVQNIIVEGVCGSGRDDDCDGASHAISCCEGAFGLTGEKLYSGGRCDWTYADYGMALECDNDQAVFGRCGSGRDADCDGGNNYHGVQCCRLLRF